MNIHEHIKRHEQKESMNYEISLSSGNKLEFETLSKMSLRFFYCFLCLDEKDQKALLNACKKDEVNHARYTNFSHLMNYDDDEKEELREIFSKLIEQDSKDIRVIAMALLTFKTQTYKSLFTRWQELEIYLIERCRYV